MDADRELKELGGRIQGGAARLAGQPLFWGLLILLLVSWPIVRSIRAEAKLPKPLPVYGTVGTFSLQDQQGEAFGSDDLQGRVWVASFIFTRCVMTCPTLTAKMQQVQHRTRNLGKAFHLVSFSVDPEHDRPEVLLQYAKEHRASRAMWSFLTSDTRDQMEQLVVGNFKLALQGEATDDDPVGLTHANRFVLVDRGMRIRGYYEVEEPGQIDRLLRDAGLLVNRGY